MVKIIMGERPLFGLRVVVGEHVILELVAALTPEIVILELGAVVGELVILELGVVVGEQAALELGVVADQPLSRARVGNTCHYRGLASRTSASHAGSRRNFCMPKCLPVRYRQQVQGSHLHRRNRAHTLAILRMTLCEARTTPSLGGVVLQRRANLGQFLPKCFSFFIINSAKI